MRDRGHEISVVTAHPHYPAPKVGDKAAPLSRGPRWHPRVAAADLARPSEHRRATSPGGELRGRIDRGRPFPGHTGRDRRGLPFLSGPAPDDGERESATNSMGAVASGPPP